MIIVSDSSPLISLATIGESEAIVLALEEKPNFVLIDDLKARKFAKMYGLKIIGTTGILLEAKKKGLIPEIKPLISELLINGIRISSRIIELTLEAAQELKKTSYFISITGHKQQERRCLKSLFSCCFFVIHLPSNFYGTCFQKTVH